MDERFFRGWDVRIFRNIFPKRFRRGWWWGKNEIDFFKSFEENFAKDFLKKFFVFAESVIFFVK